VNSEQIIGIAIKIDIESPPDKAVPEPVEGGFRGFENTVATNYTNTHEKKQTHMQSGIYPTI
jgi:hypothetical protein